MAVYNVTCDVGLDNRSNLHRNFKVQVVTNGATPTVRDVKESLQAFFPGQKVTSVYNVKVQE